MNETVQNILHNRLSMGCYVFANQTGGWLYEYYIQHLFKKYVLKLGLCDKFHFIFWYCIDMYQDKAVTSICLMLKIYNNIGKVKKRIAKKVCKRAPLCIF
jgi:hypothetical protein